MTDDQVKALQGIAMFHRVVSGVATATVDAWKAGDRGPLMAAVLRIFEEMNLDVHDAGLLDHERSGQADDAAPALLSVEEAAQLLGCGRTYMFALIGAGDVESVKVGRLRRVPRASVEAYVARLRAEQSGSAT